MPDGGKDERWGGGGGGGGGRLESISVIPTVSSNTFTLYAHRELYTL